jgi:WD40 repeat protein
MSMDGKCSRCGAPIPTSVPGQRCPKCLLEYAFDPGAAEIEEPSDSAFRISGSKRRTVHYFGDYELLEEMARGGMGVVWKARQVSLNRIVAVKLLLGGKFSSEEFVRRFRAEAEAAANLQHPNIVAIHEVGEHEGQPYFSMEFVEGQSLAERALENPLPPEQAADYVRTIAEAIHYAHQRGILHRDIKPSNILIDRLDRPRITDFGLAKRLNEDSDITLSGQVLGTPHYMSPEQAQGHRAAVTVTSDIYSLGGVLYYLLTGRPLFQAENVEATLRQVTDSEPISPCVLNAAVPRDLEIICLKCLSKEPARRYASAQEFADDLDRFLNKEPIRARPASAVEKLWRWCRRKPGIAIGLATILLLLVTVAVGATAFSIHISRANNEITKAHAETTEKLREAYLAQARANRLSGRPGHRFATLEAISNAVALGPPPKQRAQLRNQAIAAMSLPDLVPTWTLENTNGAWNGGSIDLPRSRYALVTAAGVVEVRRVPDNGLLFNLPAREAPAHLPLDFSPNGKFLAISYSNSRVAVWDLEQREVLLEDAGRKLLVEIVAFSSDSSRVAIAGTTPTVAIWDMAARRLVCAITNDSPADLTFDPAGKRIAIALYDGTALLIANAETGAILHRIEHPDRVRHPDWHPLHPLLAVGCSDGIVYFGNPDTGERTGLTPNDSGECGGVTFNHRGDLIVSATWSRLVFWSPNVPLSLGLDNSEPASLRPTFRGVGNGSLVRFNADDRSLSRVLWGMPQPKLEIDAISSAPEVRVFHSPRNNTFSILRFSLSQDGTLGLVALSNAVQILDAETGVELARLPLPGARTPVFLPGQAGLVASSDRGLFSWSLQADAESGEIWIESPRCIVGEEGWTQVRVGPTGRRLAAWHDDHGHVYSLPDFRQVSRTSDHVGGSVLGPSFSADEELLTVNRWNNVDIPIWNITTGKLLKAIRVTFGRGETHGRAEFTPDGKWLFVTTMEDLRLYELGSWTLRASLPWKSGVNQQAFLAKGKVAAVVTDSTAVAVHLLSLPDFQELAVLETANNSAIAHLGTSGDGLKLFAVREDGEVDVWNLPLIAAGLAELGLDWDDRLPAPSSPKRHAPPRFRLLDSALSENR